MRTIGATMFMVGLGQLMFQLHLLSSAGYWSAFTLGDVLGRSGGSVLGSERLLLAEFSVVMLVLGMVLMLTGPLVRLFLHWQARRLVAQQQPGRPTLAR